MLSDLGLKGLISPLPLKLEHSHSPCGNISLASFVMETV